jgi:hypothetical protein
LTTTVHWEPIESVFWHAEVCPPQVLDEQEGNDVFMCEYVYDETFRRFVRRAYPDSKGGGEGSEDDSGDAEWDSQESGSSSGSDDDEDDTEFTGKARCAGGRGKRYARAERSASLPSQTHPRP